MKARIDEEVVVPVSFREHSPLQAFACMLRVPPDGHPPFTFVMGNHESPLETVKKYGVTEAQYLDTYPRTVTINVPFYMMRYPVTNALFAEFIRACAVAGRPYATTAEQRGGAWVLSGERWASVQGASWRRPKGPGSRLDETDSRPVTCVTWHDAVAFAQWLTEQEQRLGSARDGYVYRLPTESEWEYACRAGSFSSGFWWGDKLDDEHAIHRCGQHKERSGPAPIEPDPQPGRGRCNNWGLCDMLGNVWEWCADYYDPAEPGHRVLRGGSWGSSSVPGRMLCFFRGRMLAGHAGDRNGFRIVYGHQIQ